MAFRSEALGLAFCLMATAAGAQQWEFTARQDRQLRKDRPVTVRVDSNGIAGIAWDDIQQATLTPAELRILTYRDLRWRAGRDQQFTFQGLPPGTAEKLHPLLQEQLGTRFVAAMPGVTGVAEWEVPVKLRHGFGGSEGTLTVTEDSIVYRSPERDQSRTWRIYELESVSSGGPFDLTITTPERQGVLRSGPTDFRFQLKRPMPEERFQALWRRVARGKGLAILQGDSGK